MSAFSPANIMRRPASAPVRVLMVDDSVVMRSIIARILESCAEIDLVQQVATATEAYRYLASERVDVVLLDHEMPGQKGLEALPRMLETAAGAHVVMLSSHCQRGSKTAVAALALGASDAIEKPARSDAAKAFAETLVARLRQLGTARRQVPVAEKPIVYRPWPQDFRMTCLAIGASTGGIHALGEFFSSFRHGLGVPVLVTQHLPASFMRYYAQQVERMVDLPVRVAESGEALLPDHVYIAPGNGSLCCVRDGRATRAALDPDRDPETNALPSVSRMFGAAARSYGAGVAGVVLTGIGRDGTAGGRAIVEAGGAILAQDRDSSVVWGMPGSVTRSGMAAVNLRPEQMFDYLADRCLP